MPMWPRDLGRRRDFNLTLMDEAGTYPALQLALGDAVYGATEDLVYTVVPTAPPNEYGWSEIAWIGIEQIRLWGAIALGRVRK
jgi:hypothetical protein